MKSPFAKTTAAPHGRIRQAGVPVLEQMESRMMMSATTSVVVNTLADQTDSAGSTISLRDAIATANASKAPTTITFSPTVFAKAQSIKLGGAILELTNTAHATTILGPAVGVTINGNGGKGFQIGTGVTASLSQLNIVDCGSAGAAIINGGSLNLTNVTLSGNAASAISNSGTGTAKLLDDTLSGNSQPGHGGGAIANTAGTMSLTNVTIANNTAAGYGGAILNSGGTIHLYHDTIAGNTSANFGGGIFSAFGGVTALVNTIVAGNTCTGSAVGSDVYGTAISWGFNLIGKTNGSSGWVGSDKTGTVAAPLAALLGSLTGNGGFTQTMLPATDSPAVDNGLNTGITGGISTDQRGLPRIVNNTTDIGSVEVLKQAQTLKPVIANTVSIATRFGNELVITAAGISDTIAISQTGSTLSIIGDGQTFTDPAPVAGIFVYTRGGKDSVTINASVKDQTTIDSIDNAVTTINSTGSAVIAWVDSSDIVTGTASVHAVSSFAGGISKAIGASLPNPSDSGTTTVARLSVFGTGPVATDVNQGEVGDCYFLASLAAFANQQPGVIRNSVVDLGDGTFAVEFYTNFSPTYIRVNDSFPSGYFDGFDYAHPGANNTIWAMVMEKAFAYFRAGANTYASIAEGFMSEAYMDLDVQSEVFAPTDFTDNQFYQNMQADLQSGEAVTFLTQDSPVLVTYHVYTLLSVKVVNGINEYTVRNPWGSSGDVLENSSGVATLTFAQMSANFADGAASLA